MMYSMSLKIPPLVQEVTCKLIHVNCNGQRHMGVLQFQGVLVQLSCLHGPASIIWQKTVSFVSDPELILEGLLVDTTDSIIFKNMRFDL